MAVLSYRPLFLTKLRDNLGFGFLFQVLLQFLQKSDKIDQDKQIEFG